MIINLSALMNLIEEDEKQYSVYDFGIRNYVFNTTIQELMVRKMLSKITKRNSLFN